MNLQEWIGKSETVSDIATATPYAALAATLDRAPERPSPGTPLPALWHWLYFLPLHRQSEIGPDGHAKRGGFLPPVPLPRRMWAGSQFEFHQPLRVGDHLTRVSTIHDVTEKSGRTGTLVFVKVRHEIHRGEEPDIALTEFHDIVYREAPKPDDVVPPPKAAPPQCNMGKAVGAGRRAAVPLFGAYLQRSSHPLRPPLCHRGRRLSGLDRARSDDCYAAARSVTSPVARRRS